MRVLLADSRPHVRLALRLLVERQSAPLSVVGEVVDVTMLLRDVDAIHPDLIVLEWELPGRVGTHADVLRVLRALLPEALVIVLSAHSESRKAALAAGADAFLSKSDPPSTVVTTLEACIDQWGRTYRPVN